MKRLHIIIVGAIIALTVIFSFVFSTKRPSGKTKTSSISYLKEAEGAYKSGEVQEAKILYETAKELTEDVNTLKKIQSKIEDINIEMLFSPAVDECSIKYVVYSI